MGERRKEGRNALSHRVPYGFWPTARGLRAPPYRASRPVRTVAGCHQGRQLSDLGFSRGMSQFGDFPLFEQTPTFQMLAGFFGGH